MKQFLVSLSNSCWILVATTSLLAIFFRDLRAGAVMSGIRVVSAFVFLIALIIGALVGVVVQWL